MMEAPPALVKWQCPACFGEESHVSAASEALLRLEIREHILRHEDRAGLRAVDTARLECQSIDCKIGKNGRVLNVRTNEWESKLSSYDRRLLRIEGIEWDGDKRHGNNT